MVLCCATFPLIWVGGLVTTYDAGMAVPDWPSTYGYNLLAYPLSTWFFGPWDIFIEHGHRLLGAGVGILAILFAISVFLCDSRRWMRTLSLLTLAMVIVQGVLGGARVILNERQLAMAHGCLGPAFFGLCVVLAVFTSRSWQTSKPVFHERASKLHRLALMTTVLGYLQLILGAQVRHVPLMASPRTFQFAVAFHLMTALILTGHVWALAWHVIWHHRRLHLVWSPVMLLTVLVMGQLLLGMGVWVVKFGWPAGLTEFSFAAGHKIQANSLFQSLVVTLHVALGSLIIGTSVLALIRSLRCVRAKALAIGSSALLTGVTG